MVIPFHPVAESCRLKEYPKSRGGRTTGGGPLQGHRTDERGGRAASLVVRRECQEPIDDCGWPQTLPRPSHGVIPQVGYDASWSLMPGSALNPRKEREQPYDELAAMASARLRQNLLALTPDGLERAAALGGNRVEAAAEGNPRGDVGLRGR